MKIAYKVKYQKDFGRPYTVRKRFDSIQDADDYVQDLDCEYCELVYEIIDEETGKTEFTGALCN